jgi:hypothetical protein
VKGWEGKQDRSLELQGRELRMKALTEDWRKGILPGTVNKRAGWAGEALAGAGRVPSNQERGSL